MPEFAGSYIAGEDGILRPNLDDEAMAERERMKNTPPPGGEEVKDDG